MECCRCHAPVKCVRIAGDKTCPATGLSNQPGHLQLMIAHMSGSRFSPMTKETSMNMTLSLTPMVSLIAGILILIAPSLLNYIVAFYLILIGVIGLFG